MVRYPNMHSFTDLNELGKNGMISLPQQEFGRVRGSETLVIRERVMLNKAQWDGAL